MKIDYYHIDAFTDKTFSGNPASVCVLKKWLPEESLQAIANENHLPATAFLVRHQDGFETRWFTPEYEIDLCGHGSLASGHVIFNFLEPDKSEINLYYASGILKISKDQNGISLDLPTKNLETFNSEILTEGLDAKPIELYQHKNERCLAIFHTEDEIRQLKPNITILQKLQHRGIIVTAPGKHYDFVSRTFYPKKAIYEDAVTGSSHCLLVPYWGEKLNKSRLRAYQASHRGGEIICDLKKDTVTIHGKAVVYSQGMIQWYF